MMHTCWCELLQYFRLSQGLGLDRILILWIFFLFVIASPCFPPWTYCISIQKKWKSLINCSIGLGTLLGHRELTSLNSSPSALIWINPSLPCFWVVALHVVLILYNAKPCMCSHLKLHLYCCASVWFSRSLQSFVNALGKEKHAHFGSQTFTMQLRWGHIENPLVLYFSFFLKTFFFFFFAAVNINFIHNVYVRAH